MIKLEIPALDIKASIDDGKWTCNYAWFLPILEIVPILRKKNYYDPDPDFSKANAIIAEFGGKITHHDIIEFDKDVIY